MDGFLAYWFPLWTKVDPWARALAILAIGLVLAFLVRLALTAFLRLLRVDALGKRIGFNEFLRKGGVRYTLANLISFIAFWAVLIASFLDASRLLDIEFLSTFSKNLLDVLPGLLAGALVVVVGLLIVSFFANFAVTIARNAGSSHSALIGKLTRWTGVFFVAVLALGQLGVGASLLESIFLIAFSGVVLALAIAFGLGSKDMASGFIARIVRSLKDDKNAGKDDLEG
jgi:hypothetical protein